MAASPSTSRQEQPSERALINVKKSIQLLDEAVGSPGPLLRTRTPLRHSRLDNSSSFSARTLPSRSGFDHSSSSFLPTHTPGRLGQDGTADGSTMFALNTPGKSLMSGLDYSLMSFNTTNINMLQEDPAILASTGLFKDFLQCIHNRPSEHQLFDLLRDYEAVCADQTKLLKKVVKMTTPGKSKFSKTAHMLRDLEKERWTWSLIKTLYQDRVESVMREEEEEMMVVEDDISKNKSDKYLVDNLYEKDSTTRQAQMVVDWLESIAEEGFGDYRDEVEFLQDKSGACENTLYALKQSAAGLPSVSQRQTVSEIDPDAPLRQNLPLNDLDVKDDQKLLQYLFALVRSGQLDEAQRLCTRCGQSWRAATLEGWRLYHDPNYQSPSGGADGRPSPVEGNQYRDLWKNICWKMADDERLDKYERALYAALSGNLSCLLQVSRTWEDFIWAYYKVLIDQSVEEHLRLNTRSNRSWQPLPAGYNDRIFDHESVFKEIESSSSDVIRIQSKDPYNTIIKYIVLNDIEELTKHMHRWVVETTDEPASANFQRFIAHLVLFFRSMGVQTQDELCIEILESYVKILIEEKQTDLVASYVATLTQELQVHWYACFLEGITEKEERQSCLSLAEEAGLDVAAITKCVVENIRNRRSDDRDDDHLILAAVTSEEDHFKIGAIDWLIFHPEQRAEAIRQANAVMRTFLAVKKHAAAREVFTKMPHGSIELVHRNWQMQAGSAELPPGVSNSIHEFLCIQAYLDAHDSFNDWFHHYHNTKPAEPEVVRTTTFTEKVAQEHRMKQYHIDLERWRHSLEVQTKTTVDRIYNVLLFVEGGWMVDIHMVDEPDTCRQQQMTALRRLCLPALCYLLVRVQTDSGQHMQCLQLVDVLAAESHKLYQVFHKEELQKLLAMFKDSSIALLDQGKDPLGYECV